MMPNKLNLVKEVLLRVCVDSDLVFTYLTRCSRTYILPPLLSIYKYLEVDSFELHSS